MKARRSHYELAFEACLARRGTPCVAVEDVKHFARKRTGTKLFDYIVYPTGGPACLVDVKGRKSRARADTADCRQKTWVTRADIEGLRAWQHVFGDEYRAMFVFAYTWAEEAGPAGRPADMFAFAGRRYSFWLVPLVEYARHQKMLSRSWDTVSIPVDVFRSISRPLECVWPAAPC
ncbi:MAG: HYExAFE family protein [Phycisphaerae bacterium]